MKRILSLALVIVLAASLCLSLTACGGPESVGLYSYQYLHNHKDESDAYTYTLEVFSDNTYRLNYETMWGIPMVTLVYGRDVTAYGNLTVKEENAEEGTITYLLEMPTRIQLITESRSAVTCVVDTANWPAGNPDEDIPAGISYTINERATTEVYETPEALIAAVGRTYEIVCDTTNGNMTVTVTSHDGQQIPFAGIEPAAE